VTQSAALPVELIGGGGCAVPAAREKPAGALLKMGKTPADADTLLQL